MPEEYPNIFVMTFDYYFGADAGVISTLQLINVMFIVIIFFVKGEPGRYLLMVAGPATVFFAMSSFIYINHKHEVDKVEVERLGGASVMAAAAYGGDGQIDCDVAVRLWDNLEGSDFFMIAASREDTADLYRSMTEARCLEKSRSDAAGAE